MEITFVLLTRVSIQRRVLFVNISNTTCMISAPAGQVCVVYVYENQGLFLNIVTTRELCSSKFSLEYLWGYLKTDSSSSLLAKFLVLVKQLLIFM